MFPLGTNFIELSQFTLLFSVCSVSFLVAPKWNIAAIIPFIVCVVFYKWTTYETNYDNVSYAIYAAGLTVLVIASAFWAFVVNIVFAYFMGHSSPPLNIQPRLFLRLILSLLPAFVVVLFAFERQIIPDTACSTEGITVTLGTQDYFLRPEFSASIRVSQTEAYEPMRLTYSTSVDHKESLKIACEISYDGTAPILVSELRIYPHSAYGELSQRCAESGLNAENSCVDLDGANFQHVGSLFFTESPEKFLQTMDSWFKHENDPSVLTDGNMKNGFVCWGDESKDEQVNCMVWYPIDENITVVARSIFSETASRIELVEKIHEAVDFTLKPISN